MMSKKKSPDFEAAIDQLEILIEQIESGEIGLEESLKRYEDGSKLIQHCRTILDSAEKKIAELAIESESHEAAESESSESPSI